ncbi:MULTISPECIES: hypothetical protein [unclassified Exiguobacterium]|uniref:deoxynucleotide monophosphate kinase family protein n=1 Tax=unclassified Exiguobacterium TaxID=2644629 RepID=UPI001BE77C0B|nr:MULTISPECIES: hypothetical protein [unclassified Exiguobacterium]
MNEIKVAIVGKIRAGKDTVGDVFKETQRCKQLAFADAIGDVIETYFPEAAKLGKPRKHYQTIGQTFRSLDSGVWVKQLHKAYVQAKLEGHMNFVVTDLRQMNEYDYLKGHGFHIIKVVADDEVRIERMRKSGDVFNEEDLLHSTEAHVDAMPCDYVITNNTSLKDLYIQVQKIVNDIKGVSK